MGRDELPTVTVRATILKVLRPDTRGHPVLKAPQLRDGSRFADRTRSLVPIYKDALRGELLDQLLLRRPVDLFSRCNTTYLGPSWTSLSPIRGAHTRRSPFFTWAFECAFDGFASIRRLPLFAAGKMYLFSTVLQVPVLHYFLRHGAGVRENGRDGQTLLLKYKMLVAKTRLRN